MWQSAKRTASSCRTRRGKNAIYYKGINKTLKNIFYLLIWSGKANIKLLSCCPNNPSPSLGKCLFNRALFCFPSLIANSDKSFFSPCRVCCSINPKHHLSDGWKRHSVLKMQTRFCVRLIGNFVGKDESSSSTCFGIVFSLGRSSSDVRNSLRNCAIV